MSKTKRVLETRIKPGQSFVLKDGNIELKNYGQTTARIQVITPVPASGVPNESQSK